ncbi:glycosyltransferase involved in cell wall biosynthesis [Ulvibacter sp. MAR_2010_11]|uniref:glycosyltransferase family 2 protein n=1 Tax=Ulvibacter sp. MAR_2010_11 TaxID=1250229 RepID=UPI000C2BF97C|nr:glycosyltransferase family 2 protein [Ulvibacter sp. MAR_2010_11]PKA82127.1 glycosyltransferase involved in cell wall biosynthesis [Ulvibacter sp. MAR_2010_11]
MVSIIVPNYNHEPYLRKRLDSIFSQTYGDFEVILLDDCSTDNSVSILQEYAERPQVSHFIINKENSGGPFKQWKKGIELSKSDYIWIAESDDYSDTSFLERLIPFFKKGIGIVFSGLTIVEQNNSKDYVALEEGFHKGTHLLSAEMITGNLFINANCVLFNKKYISKSQLTKICDFKICGDWSLWNHILTKSNVYFVKEPLSFYRKHQSATTENLYNNQLFYKEAIKVAKVCINFLGNYYHHNARAIRFYGELVRSSKLSEAIKAELLKLINATFKPNFYINLFRRIVRKLKSAR